MSRRTLSGLLAGVTIGVIASMWWGPSLITWWFTPPGHNVILNACNDQIDMAMRRLVQWQLGSGLGLGVVLAVLANVWASRHRKVTPPASPTPTNQTRPA